MLIALAKLNFLTDFVIFLKVWSMLNKTVARVPDRIALSVKRPNGEIETWTYKQYQVGLGSSRSIKYLYL